MTRFSFADMVYRAFLAFVMVAPAVWSDESKKDAPPAQSVADVQKADADAASAVKKANDTRAAFSRELAKLGLPPLEALGIGKTGPMPRHEWQGTKLRFELPGGKWGPWVELQGAKGDVGPPGPPGPKPDPDPNPDPPPAPTGKVARFVVVEDTSKAGKWRGDVLGSEKVQAFYRALQGSRATPVHRLIDVAANDGDVFSNGFREKARAKASLPWLWLFDDAGIELKNIACPITPDAFIAAFDLAPAQRAMGLKFAKPKLAWTKFGETPNTPLIPRAMWKPMDLVWALPPVHDQDGRGQCASSAACAVLEACRKQAGLPYVYLSAGDLYSRVNGGRDEGSFLEDNLAELVNNGVAPVSMVPYVWDGKKRTDLTTATERKKYRVIEAYLCTSFDAMASALQQGFLIEHGLWWHSNFEPGSDGWLPLRGGGRAGGHALMGYGVAMKADGTWGIKTRNSWSASWGAAGNCIIAENLFDSDIGGWFAVRAVVQTNDATFPLSKGRTRLPGVEYTLAP